MDCITPTVNEMESWHKEQVLGWIENRKPNLLRDGDLKNFNDANIIGYAFLIANRDFFQSCGISPGVSLVLENLVNEVNGKLLFFIRH